MIYQVQDEDRNILDAKLELDSTGIDYFSRGGNKQSGTNIDYGKGLQLILERLKTSNIEISGIWVNSSRVQHLPIKERLILSGREFKQKLHNDAFTIISKRMKNIGQLRKSKGGNSTKKIRIQFEKETPQESSRIALILYNSKAKNPSTSRIVEIKKKNKNSSKIVLSKREIIVKKNEDDLVNRYKKFLKNKNLGVLKKNFIDIIDENTTLETDGWIEKTKTLIEAKSDSSRENIRMAIGQLHDYKRHLNPQPKSLAVLLPTCPRNDLVELLTSQKIDIIYEKDKEFVTKNK